jgi:hypothetical protein
LARVRGLLIYCSDYKCSHSTTITGDRWSDDVRLSDIEPQVVCEVCGKRGADVRPDFNWEKQQPVAAMAYRWRLIGRALLRTRSLHAIEAIMSHIHWMVARK